MFNNFDIDPDEYYNPEFYKYAHYQLVQQNFPFVGETIAAFNSLENELNDSIVDYIDIKNEDIGWIVISGLPFNAKMHLWRRLVSYYMNYIKEDEVKKEWENRFSKLYYEIDEIKGIRNKVVHADWDNMNEQFFVKTETKLKADGIKHSHLLINKEEFENIINKIECAELDLINFNKDFEKLLKLNIT